MRESQLIHELAELWTELERLKMAHNMLVHSYADQNVRLRAYENLINKSYFLRIFLRLPKIEREINRIDIEEASLKGLKARIRDEQIKNALADMNVKKRQTELERLLKLEGKKELHKKSKKDNSK